MNDMELYTTIEAVMNFNLSDDAEMSAMESQLESIEYAMESAQFEYDTTGDESYLAVIEAAQIKNADSDKSWWEILVKRVSSFVKNAIASIRAMLSRITNRVRLARAKGMAKKVDKVKDMSANYEFVKVPAGIAALMGTGLNVGAVDAAINGCIDRALTKIKSDGSVDKDWRNSEEKKIFDAPEKGGKEGSAQLNANQIKGYLDKSVTYLNALTKSFPKAKSKINDLGASNMKSKGEIRAAVTAAYNVVTAAVKRYYSYAMQFGRALTKSSDVEKSK